MKKITTIDKILVILSAISVIIFVVLFASELQLVSEAAATGNIGTLTIIDRYMFFSEIIASLGIMCSILIFTRNLKNSKKVIFRLLGGIFAVSLPMISSIIFFASALSQLR